jgi:hypothetical protein
LLSAIGTLHPYSKTASISPLIFAFPPEGSASTVPQTLQLTLFTALLNTICSLPHFRHLTRMKLLLGLGMSFSHSDKIFPPSQAMTNFANRMPSLCLMKPQTLHFNFKVCFFVVLANSL